MNKITLKIDGMSCGMCESHINDAIRNAFKIKKVSSSFKKGETEILTQEELSEDELNKIIDSTGYKIISYNIEPYQRKKFSLFS